MIEGTVKNYRKMELAEIEIPVVALIQGANMSGKSSIMWALRSTVLGMPTPDSRYLPVKWLKDDLKDLVNPHGPCYAQVSSVEGGHHMVWPEGEYTTKGKAPKVSKVAAGYWEASIGNMDTKTRKEALANLLTAECPDRSYFTDMMGNVQEKVVDDVMKMVKEIGWEPALTRADGRLKELKGKWEAITKEQYGSKKIVGWRPAGWEKSMEALTPEICQQAVEAAATKVRGSGENAGATAQLKHLADMLPTRVNAVRDAQEGVTNAETALTQQQTIVDELPPSDDGSPAKCPHCDEELLVMPDKSVIKPGDLRITKDELTKRRMERAGAEGKLARLKSELGNKRNILTLAERDLAQSQEASNKVDELGDESKEQTEAFDRYTQAVKVQGLVDMKTKADRVSAALQVTLEIITALKPTGIRARVMMEKMGELNQKLASVAADFRMPLVQLTADCEIQIGTELFRNVSMSQQERTKIVFQVAMAEMDGSDLVLIDNDVDMDKNWQAALVQMMLKRYQTSHLHAVIALRYDTVEQAFNTAKSSQEPVRQGVASYWLDNGRCKRLVSAEAAA